MLASGLSWLAACSDSERLPDWRQQVDTKSQPLSPDAALERFVLQPGYSIELVASEPLVQDPVAIDFDADGRMWVVEMRGYMPNARGEGEGAPVGRIVVLEDLDWDGRMDTSTVYLDGLVLPRAIRVLDGGALVAATPYLWLTRDTDGDLQADVVEVLRDDYGTLESNPEFNANGLLWGLDNMLHSAHYAGILAHAQGAWLQVRAPALGQWGISMDDYGRVYRNFSEQPLHVDFVASHYYGRNLFLTRTRGIYESVYDGEGRFVWPAHATPGVNRGYLPGVLRQDGRLTRFTAAGAPVAYRGDRLPQDLRNNVFVTEPAGNLVRRYLVTETPDGLLAGRNAYERSEFLASTDERFRPVNLASAPDGSLYVVDMYRGVIQHSDFVSDYLRDQIERRGLETPLGFGRIYRIVHRSTVRGPRPQLSRSTAADLVATLAHPNGWWRDTAQRLLVERGERSATLALRALAQSAEIDYVRLHALWTLDGLQEVDAETLVASLADPSPHARAAAIRIAEPWLVDPEHPVSATVLAQMGDREPVVRRQLAASLGTPPRQERVAWLADLVVAHGDDPIVVDVALSGLLNDEVSFIERLVRHEEGGALATREEVLALTMATIFTSDRSAEVHRLLDWVAAPTTPAEHRHVLRVAIEAALSGLYRLRVDRQPDLLADTAWKADPEMTDWLTGIAAQIIWPGKPDLPPYDDPNPLTVAEARSFMDGRQLYATTCAVCHQGNGIGVAAVAPPLVGSDWVLGPASRLTRILLQGLEGERAMPALGRVLSDQAIADVATYIRRAWGHQSSPVGVSTVEETRLATAARDRPWTADELRNEP